MHSLLNKTFLLNINMGGNKGKKAKKIKNRDQPQEINYIAWLPENTMFYPPRTW